MSNPFAGSRNQGRNIEDIIAEYNKRPRTKAKPEDYSCPWCGGRGTEKVVRAHQRKCEDNPSNRKPMPPEDFSKAYKAYVAENIRKARASFPAEAKSNASSRKVRTATGHAVTTVASGKGTSFSAASPDKKKRNISVTSDMPLKKILASMRKAKKKKKKKTQGNPQEGSGRRQRRTRRKKKRNSRRRRIKKRRRSRKYRRRTRR